MLLFISALCMISMATLTQRLINEGIGAGNEEVILHTGVIMILVIVAVLGLMALLVPRIFNAYDERQQRLDALNNTLQENLSGVRVVKAFVREELEEARFAERADAMRQPARRAAFMTGFLSPLLSGIWQVAIATAIWVGGQQVFGGAQDYQGQHV